ncbi:hypothetical protein glysoja_046586 [Glycine soja]|uniref:Uncharacterized protein n=1 Tax=Glycine soja TaxID=3848 RepID=A0A0B2PEU6_GLYSO|nr:hypothetical protein glysoja_046586 [Glycine soja]
MRKSHGMIARGDEAALANRQGLRNHVGISNPRRAIFMINKFLLFVVSGIRIFEDVCSHKNGKGVLVKSVGVIDATADSVFEVFLNTERQKRYEWHSKRDFVFSRQWFRAQDGTYTILQFPSIHKKKPPRSGYRRTKINRILKA